MCSPRHSFSRAHTSLTAHTWTRIFNVTFSWHLKLPFCAAFVKLKDFKSTFTRTHSHSHSDTNSCGKYQPTDQLYIRHRSTIPQFHMHTSPLFSWFHVLWSISGRIKHLITQSMNKIFAKNAEMGKWGEKLNGRQPTHYIHERARVLSLNHSGTLAPKAKKGYTRTERQIITIIITIGWKCFRGAKERGRRRGRGNERVCVHVMCAVDL